MRKQDIFRCDRCNEYGKEGGLVTLEGTVTGEHAGDVAVCGKCFDKYTPEQWQQWVDGRYRLLS